MLPLFPRLKDSHDMSDGVESPNVRNSITPLIAEDACRYGRNFSVESDGVRNSAAPMQEQKVEHTVESDGIRKEHTV